MSTTTTTSQSATTSPLTRLIIRHPLIAFFVIAFAGSWIATLPLVLAQNGLGLLANLHVAAGVGGGPWLEYPWDPPGWTAERRDFFLAEPVHPDAEGCLAVPDAPGLGARIDEPAVARWAAP